MTALACHAGCVPARLKASVKGSVRRFIARLARSRKTVASLDGSLRLAMLY